MNDTPICPCESPEHPQAISNPPGQDAIAYRVGHYSTFRQALLRPLKEGQPQEMELKNWNPSAKGDLALQMVEWWAYLADILTFYNERVANESYLRTADLTESVRRLIRLLGYRPRPGIGATGVVAALTNARTPFTLPPGFQLQSKPGPGKQPQVFELNAATPVSFPDAVEVDPAPDSTLLADETEPLKGKYNSVLLKGTITAAKVGDRLLILNRSRTRYALGTVAEVQQEKDPRGSVNTRLRFSESFPDLAGARATDYRLAKSLQFAHLWPYPAGPGFVIESEGTVLAGGGGAGALQSFRYTVTGLEPDLGDFMVPLPSPRSTDDYRVTATLAGTALIVGLDLPDLLAGDRTTTEFRLISTFPLTAGDQIDFHVFDEELLP